MQLLHGMEALDALKHFTARGLSITPKRKEKLTSEPVSTICEHSNIAVAGDFNATPGTAL